MLHFIFRGYQNAGFFAHAMSYNDGNGPLQLLPGNERTPDARYACIVSVRDYWRMISRRVQQQGEWHYSTGIEREVLEDTRAGRAIIIFDLTNEGPGYWTEVFDELYNWAEKNAIPEGRIVWLAQNRAIANDAMIISGDRSKSVRFEYYDFNVKMMAWKFSSIAPSIERVPIYNHDAELAVNELFKLAVKDRLLLCLNATPRLNRILTLAGLFHYHLFERSLVSFGGFQYVKQGETIEGALRFATTNPRLTYLLPEIQKLKEIRELVIDSFDEKGNDLVFKVDPRCYERTFFSLVTESEISNGAINRITEKTAKAFCMGHPTLVVGNPNSISLMTELGFQDWDSVIDRSYETIVDPAERFVEVLREALRQVHDIQTDARGWLTRTREIGAWNLRHAFNGGMLSRYISLYDMPIINRLTRLLSQ